MSMEEKQNSLTFQDFNQSVLKPETRENISLIIQECYKKNIPIEINCLQSKKNIGRNFQVEKTLNLSNYKGIIEYKPEELYIKVKAGTSIREIKAANAMSKMGEYDPSFGMIGTLFGLIFMLGGMVVPQPPGTDPTAKLIGSMAVALITTLYGALFAFFIFIPFSDYLKYVNEEKKVESALQLSGTLMLLDKTHPIIVRERLNAFLSRKDRFTDDE